MTRRAVLLRLLLVGLLVGLLAAQLGRQLTAFPGRIATPALAPTEEGGRSTYHEGVIYRHAGAVPLLEVSGSHYQLGLQYGVLLRPEILAALGDAGAVRDPRRAREVLPISAGDPQRRSSP